MLFRAIFTAFVTLFCFSVSQASTVIEINCTLGSETTPTILVDTALKQQSFPEINIDDATVLITEDTITLRSQTTGLVFDLNTGKVAQDGKVYPNAKCEYSNLQALEVQHSSKSVKGTTDEGKRVLLSDDGTWKYIEAD